MKPMRMISALPLVFTLVACGGSGGGGTFVSSTPTPMPNPTPTPTPTPTPPPVVEAVSIVPTMSNTTLAVSAPSQNPALTMRYDAATGTYLVSVPGVVDSVVEDVADTPINPATGLQYLRASGTNLYDKLGAVGASDPKYQYRYSSLVSAWDWTNDAYSKDAYAVGIATPVASVPTTGSASFSGIVGGSSTVSTGDDWCPVGGILTGTIDVQVDFAAGTLNGQLASSVLGFEAHALPPLTFTGALTSGANAYSGSFSTALAGTNSLSGQFTGPGAEETIGSFTFPFSVPAGFNQAEGSVANAFGSYIAKR